MSSDNDDDDDDDNNNNNDNNDNHNVYYYYYYLLRKSQNYTSISSAKKTIDLFQLKKTFSSNVTYSKTVKNITVFVA